MSCVEAEKVTERHIFASTRGPAGSSVSLSSRAFRHRVRGLEDHWQPGAAPLHTGTGARDFRVALERAIPVATRTYREAILMNRRQVLSATVTLLVAPAVRAADEPVHVPFTQEAYEQALANGEPLLLDFYASW